jgi:hypothetical protein
LFVFSVVLDCLVLHDPNYPGLLFLFLNGQALLHSMNSTKALQPLRLDKAAVG